MADLQFEPGDAPCVRDLLLQHFRDEDLEVEGKLGRCLSNGKFKAGVSEEQFMLLEGELATKGVPLLGLPPRAGLPHCEKTLDRFYGSSAVDIEGPPRRKRRWAEEFRLSYACDISGNPQNEPFETLQKCRLADCHVASTGSLTGPRDLSLATAVSIGLRVSFSQETAAPKGVATAEGSTLIYERRKERRTWEAPLWQVALTRVSAECRDAFEVEVELRMEAVRPRLEAAISRGDEALRITRELVAALRALTSLVAAAPAGQKRRRTEDFRAAEPELRSALDAPEVVAELCRRMREGRRALHQAKQYLCDVLRARCSTVDEAALYRFAGQHVARALLRQRSVADLKQECTQHA